MISPQKHHSHDHLHILAVLYYQYTFTIFRNCPCLTHEATAWVHYILCCVVLSDFVYKFCYIGNIFFGTMEFLCLNLQMLLQWYMKSETLLHKEIQTTGKDRGDILFYIYSVILVFIKMRLHWMHTNIRSRYSSK